MRINVVLEIMMIKEVNKKMAKSENRNSLGFGGR